MFTAGNNGDMVSLRAICLASEAIKDFSPLY